MRRAPAVLLPLLLVLAACGSPDRPDRAAPPSSTPATATSRPPSTAPPSPSPSSRLGATCRAEGFRIDHPAGWSVNDEGEPCRWFHPEPFTLPEAQEATGLAVSLRFTPRPFAEMVAAVDDGLEEVLQREEHQVDGRSAVRWELRSTGEALLPEGTRSTQWLVDTGSRALLAVTSSAATGGSYEDHVAVLDAMVRSLRVEEGGAPCSAAGLPADLPEQDGLPDPVAQTRQALYRAAVQCDLERLGALAADEGFTWSFGLDGDPADGWRAAEQRGEAPMRYLAGVLRLPHGRQQVQGRTLWVWPEAHAAGSWSEVPEAARQDLRTLYDERDLRSWEQFGAYAGHRVVVADDGTWQAFVAGD